MSKQSTSTWNQTRALIEKGFERWGYQVSRRPWWTILLCLLAVGALASQLPQLEIDTSTEGFLEANHPTRLRHNAFREQFGAEEVAVVAIRTDEVFEMAFLERLRSLHEALEDEVPHLEEVTSLVNVRHTRGVGDELRVDDFLEEWPESEDQLAELRSMALANPLYRGVLLADDATLATLMVESEAFTSIGQSDDALQGFDSIDLEPGSDDAAGTPPIPLTGPENSAFVRTIMEVAQRYDAPDFRIHVAGQPTLVDRIMSQMLSDMGRFTALSLLVIGGFLAFLFRSAMAVVLALGVSALSVLCWILVHGGGRTPAHHGPPRSHPPS